MFYSSGIITTIKVNIYWVPVTILKTLSVLSLLFLTITIGDGCNFYVSFFSVGEAEVHKGNLPKNWDVAESWIWAQEI